MYMYFSTSVGWLIQAPHPEETASKVLQCGYMHVSAPPDHKQGLEGSQSSQAIYFSLYGYTSSTQNCFGMKGELNSEQLYDNI